MAIMRRVDEQLRFLHQLHGAIGIDGLARADKFLGLEHVLGEFTAGIFVPEELRFVKPAGELRENLIFIFGNARILRLDQPLRGTHHGGISRFRSVLRAAAVK